MSAFSHSPILIIGTSHRFQIEGYGTDRDWERFSFFLESLVKKNPVDLIAEELNDEVISLCHACDSVARVVSRRLGIRHLFCDPDSAERNRLGIKRRKEIVSEFGFGGELSQEQSMKVDAVEQGHWDKRERYWLERLLEEKRDGCIFILGANHVERFCRLLDGAGLSWEVIEKDWSPHVS